MIGEKCKGVNWFFGFVLFCLIVILSVGLISEKNPTQYEARCLTGNYQVYRKEYSYYLLENDEKFLPYGNCVFVEAKK